MKAIKTDRRGECQSVFSGLKSAQGLTRLPEARNVKKSGLVENKLKFKKNGGEIKKSGVKLSKSVVNFNVPGGLWNRRRL